MVRTEVGSPYWSFDPLLVVMALVKARGPRWFGFSLLCILNSFNGVRPSFSVCRVFGALTVMILGLYGVCLTHKYAFIPADSLADTCLEAFSVLSISKRTSLLICIFPATSPRLLVCSLTDFARWGAVIVLGVNLLVFPTSSERELRHTLVSP
jgi:hypothetical protein